MSFYRYVRPLLFRLPAESSHNATLALLRAIQRARIHSMIGNRLTVSDPRLAVEAFGLDFPNPVGIAAGFDKNGEVPNALASLGFGHVEIGGVTAQRQAGNPRPRLFRLIEDEAIINRMGFNNDGADRVADRLENSSLPPVPLGINIGKSKATSLEAAPNDYRYTYERLARFGDYFVVNVSSPNTPGLRSLQNRHHLTEILETLQAAGAAPLLVKLSPDLSTDAIEDAIAVAESMGADGIIAVNTTIDRPETLRSSHRDETGGLSGRPLERVATDVIGFVANRTTIPIIGVGGVFSAEDAYRKIRAGASVVQLYTGLIYRGPSIAAQINRGILTLLERDGFESVADARGTESAGVVQADIGREGQSKS